MKHTEIAEVFRTFKITGAHNYYSSGKVKIP